MNEIWNRFRIYLFLLLGMMIGILMIWMRRERLKQDHLWQAVLTALAFTGVCYAATLVFADIESLLIGGSTEGDAISTYGVYLLAGPAIYLGTKLLLLKSSAYLDMLAIYVLPTFLLMRCNCMIAGCCMGKEIFSTGLRWPTRMAELIFYAVLLIQFHRMERNEKHAGQLYPFLLMTYGGFRFFNEWFRVEDPIIVGMHLAHIWSIISLIIGLSIYAEQKNQASCAATYRKVRRK